uniref:hypothetical protein n=1 Tax=Thermogutta sp. TaxID=1962930 RepID=UPI00321F92DC
NLATSVFLNALQASEFFLLPSIVVALLFFSRMGLSTGAKRRISYALIAGMVITFLSGETYFATLAMPALYAAVLGAAIIWVGLALGAYYSWGAYRSSGSAGNAPAAQ